MDEMRRQAIADLRWREELERRKMQRLQDRLGYPNGVRPGLPDMMNALLDRIEALEQQIRESGP